jgi:xylulokinase
MPLVLGVDSAATATTAEFRDADTGQVFASGTARHLAAEPNGDADPRVWWQALVEARGQAGGALGVGAMSVAAPPRGLVLLDASQQVLGPAIRSRAADRDVAALLDALGSRQDWVAAVGSVPGRSTPIAQLAWLRRTDPGLWGRIASVLTPASWLTHRLSRAFATDRGDASWTGYWSPRENQWRVDLLAFVDEAKDWGMCLPHLRGPQEQAGDRQGVVIAPGTGDAMAAALGLGLQPGDVVVELDQPARVFTVREIPTEDATGAVAGLADATGRYLPCVRLADGMNVVSTVARLMGIADPKRFDQLALRAPAGAGGVTVLPEFARDGRPADLAHRGMIIGLGADVSAEQLARATVEGIVCRLLEALDALRSADVPVGGRLFLTGAGARSRAVRHVLADVAERPIIVAPGNWVAAGAAVQAAGALQDRSPAELAGFWNLAPTNELEPDTAGDGSRVRAQFRAARGIRPAAPPAATPS